MPGAGVVAFVSAAPHVIEVVAMLGDTMLDVVHLEHGAYRVGTERVVEVSGGECAVIKDGCSTQLADMPAWANVGLVRVRVSRVARPARTLPHPVSGDRRVALWLSISLAVHLLVWGVANDVSPYDGGAAGRVVDVRPFHRTRIGTSRYAPSELGASEAPRTPGTGVMHTVAGDVHASRGAGQFRIEDLGTRQLTRAEAIEIARTSGVMSGPAWHADAFRTLIASTDLSTGFDNTPVYRGGDGDTGGGFGFGVAGTGPGCDDVDCRGVIASGRYGTIGAGAGYEGGGRGAGGMRTREAQVPTVYMCGRPEGGRSSCVIVGDLDKQIIRRYIRRQLAKITYCYEKELLAQPSLVGDVVVDFLIGPDGHVSTAQGSGPAPVADCIAGVIAAIEFPRSKTGTSTKVRYPFLFHRAGD